MTSVYVDTGFKYLISFAQHISHHCFIELAYIQMLKKMAAYAVITWSKNGV